MNTREATQQYRTQLSMKLIQGRKESGLNVSKYCSQQGIRPKQYYYWLHKLRTMACKELEPTAPIVPIPVSILNEDPPVSGSPLVLHFGPVSLEINDHTSDALLKKALQAVRELASC